ncbi:hypothetical protein [Pseudooceanicola sp.]|uniref:hypothetical protein n=1 Tax=Pseudooceanicola sp. TaxID=1914328 RepID=UPI002619272B|nr:hypothetical protein [Pseudooceanicola sp.]MDF1854335.1 hypothetical protein [Pseudooceanicola sp.]
MATNPITSPHFATIRLAVLTLTGLVCLSQAALALPAMGALLGGTGLILFALFDRRGR